MKECLSLDNVTGRIIHAGPGVYAVLCQTFILEGALIRLCEISGIRISH